MHGGAHGSGAPFGERNGNYRHGRYSKARLEERKLLMQWLRAIRQLAKTV
jgi:hypothetical protein